MISLKRTLIQMAVTAILVSNGLCLNAGPNDVYVRVVDVGAGLSCVIALPGQHFIIYDAGLYTRSMPDIRDVIPTSESIDLLVLSHSDYDHIGAVEQICNEYTVDRVLRTGYVRTTATWQRADRAIRREVRRDDALDINLTESEFLSGSTYRFGEVFVTMICGFPEPPEDWDMNSLTEERNAISICL